MGGVETRNKHASTTGHSKHKEEEEEEEEEGESEERQQVKGAVNKGEG